MTSKPAEWDAFYASVMEIFWPCVPPELRFEERPDPPEGDAAVPGDIWRVVLLAFPDQDAWLHNPIPNLRRRTPLQVLAAGEADALRQILMEVAPFMLPDPSEVQPWREE